MGTGSVRWPGRSPAHRLAALAVTRLLNPDPLRGWLAWVGQGPRMGTPSGAHHLPRRGGWGLAAAWPGVPLPGVGDGAAAPSTPAGVTKSAVVQVYRGGRSPLTPRWYRQPPTSPLVRGGLRDGRKNPHRHQGHGSHLDPARLGALGSPGNPGSTGNPGGGCWGSRPGVGSRRPGLVVVPPLQRSPRTAQPCRLGPTPTTQPHDVASATATEEGRASASNLVAPKRSEAPRVRRRARPDEGAKRGRQAEPLELSVGSVS